MEMIAFVIYDIDVCGGTHKQLLKLIEYTDRQGQNFKIITKKLDLNKTYDGFKRFAGKIEVYDRNEYPAILNHRIIWRLIEPYNKWRLRRMVKDCDVVNIHDNNFEEIYFELKGKKVYWQINDLHYCFRVGVAANMDDSERAKQERNYILRSTRNFTAITVNVSKNAERVKECLGREAEVYYCGVEPIGIKHNVEESFERFGKKKINLLSSGVFFPYRNYETQIEVVKALREKGYDVNLHIIGDTSRGKEYADKIQSMIDANGLHEVIAIEGQVDNNRFKYLHQNADIFLFINVDQSWGLAVFEAQSCGLPVIVSNSVGATEILQDDNDSIFVEPKDVPMIIGKIEKLVNNKDYYTRISIAASEFYKEWTWDKAYCSKMYDLMMR